MIFPVTGAIRKERMHENCLGPEFRLLKQRSLTFFGTKEVNENCSSLVTFVKKILFRCGAFKTKGTHFFGYAYSRLGFVCLIVCFEEAYILQ